jgi:predicted nuclease of restriction endonuclease-like (RecB) superfamily
MRSFAEAWPDEEIVQGTLAQIPWYHHVALLEKVKEREERLWYARQVVESGWSRNVLVHQIESALFSRQGRAITNFDRTLPAPHSELAQQILKDPYNFDFLSIGTEMLERDLERGLIEHLRDLILELGKGFAFVGNQFHLEVGGQDFYLDLLFYHLRLRCYVVFELKIEDFKPEFAGKMNFYLSAIDDQLRHPEDRASIGIILCKGRNEIIVEYALRDTSKPMGVAQYRLTAALPEELEGELPTTSELSGEFPLLSLVRLRIDIEKKLAALVKANGLQGDERPRGARLLATTLHTHDIISTELMANILRVGDVLTKSVHGLEVTPEDAEAVIAVGNRILADLGMIP